MAQGGQGADHSAYQQPYGQYGSYGAPDAVPGITPPPPQTQFAAPAKSGSGKLVAVAVIILVLAGIGSAVVYISFPSGGNQPPPGGTVTLKIGVILSQTGQLGHDGALMVRGVQLKAEQINAAGGFKMGDLTAKIDLVIEDDRTDPVTGKTAAMKLVDSDKVQAIVGDTGSTICLAIETHTGPSKVPIVSPSCTSPKLTDKPWIFRTVGSDIFQSGALVDTAVAMQKAGLVGNKIIVFSVANAYGQGIHEIVKKRAAEKGLEVIYEALFEENQVGYEPQAAAMKQAKQDKSPTEGVTGIYTSYPEDGITFFGAAGKLGLIASSGYVWLGTDGLSNSDVFIKDTNINGYIQGMYATNPSAKPGDADYEAFRSAYKQKYGGEEPTAYAATAYDALGVIAKAIEMAGAYDGQKIKDALNRMTGADAYKGVSGTKDFDLNGDIRSQYYQINKVVGTTFVPTGGWWEDPTKGVQDFVP